MPTIRSIPSGVPGLDRILGGGFPEYSFNLIVGDPGTGKTTLVNQILFSNATEETPALYITLAGEPPIKMLRYQQQFTFFDRARVGGAVELVNLEDEVVSGELEAVLARIEEEVERVDPSFVVVDSMTSLQGTFFGPAVDESGTNLRRFVRRLGMYLTRWEATSFLIGEFSDEALPHGPIFTVADGVIRVNQVIYEDATVRKLRVLKLRGRREIPGFHTFRITETGVQVFPRIGPPRVEPAAHGGEAGAGIDEDGGRRRLSFGVEGLDAMTSGGALEGDSIMVSGPSGSGKSVLAMHFLRAGLDAGESVVVAAFEENPSQYRERAEQIGIEWAGAEADGRLALVHQPLPDLSVSEAFAEITARVKELGATRVVIDSLTGLEISVSDPSERRVREGIFQNVQALTARGVTVMLVSEVGQTVDALRLTPHEVSVLADDVILQRYVEIRGKLENVLTVVKMRRSGHSRVFHRYHIRDDGLHVGREVREFHGVLTGVPQLTSEPEATRGADSEGEDAEGAEAGGGDTGPGSA
ncbi:MAG: ATPase domain-containing protein [Candidatus Longimicrobiales bacterium M2_2A_002]